MSLALFRLRSVLILWHGAGQRWRSPSCLHSSTLGTVPLPFQAALRRVVIHFYEKSNADHATCTILSDQLADLIAANAGKTTARDAILNACTGLRILRMLQQVSALSTESAFPGSLLSMPVPPLMVPLFKLETPDHELESALPTHSSINSEYSSLKTVMHRPSSVVKQVMADRLADSGIGIILKELSFHLAAPGQSSFSTSRIAQSIEKADYLPKQSASSLAFSEAWDIGTLQGCLMDVCTLTVSTQRARAVSAKSLVATPVHNNRAGKSSHKARRARELETLYALQCRVLQQVCDKLAGCLVAGSHTTHFDVSVDAIFSMLQSVGVRIIPCASSRCSVNVDGIVNIDAAPLIAACAKNVICKLEPSSYPITLDATARLCTIFANRIIATSAANSDTPGLYLRIYNHHREICTVLLRTQSSLAALEAAQTLLADLPTDVMSLSILVRKVASSVYCLDFTATASVILLRSLATLAVWQQAHVALGGAAHLQQAMADGVAALRSVVTSSTGAQHGPDASAEAVSRELCGGELVVAISIVSSLLRCASSAVSCFGTTLLRTLLQAAAVGVRVTADVVTKRSRLGLAMPSGASWTTAARQQPPLVPFTPLSVVPAPMAEPAVLLPSDLRWRRDDVEALDRLQETATRLNVDALIWRSDSSIGEVIETPPPAATSPTVVQAPVTSVDAAVRGVLDGVMIGGISGAAICDVLLRAPLPTSCPPLPLRAGPETVDAVMPAAIDAADAGSLLFSPSQIVHLIEVTAPLLCGAWPAPLRAEAADALHALADCFIAACLQGSTTAELEARAVIACADAGYHYRGLFIACARRIASRKHSGDGSEATSSATLLRTMHALCLSLTFDTDAFAVLLRALLPNESTPITISSASAIDDRWARHYPDDTLAPLLPGPCIHEETDYGGQWNGCVANIRTALLQRAAFLGRAGGGQFLKLAAALPSRRIRSRTPEEPPSVELSEDASAVMQYGGAAALAAADFTVSESARALIVAQLLSDLPPQGRDEEEGSHSLLQLAQDVAAAALTAELASGGTPRALAWLLLPEVSSAARAAGGVGPWGLATPTAADSPTLDSEEASTAEWAATSVLHTEVASAVHACLSAVAALLPLTGSHPALQPAQLSSLLPRRLMGKDGGRDAREACFRVVKRLERHYGLYRWYTCPDTRLVLPLATFTPLVAPYGRPGAAAGESPLLGRFLGRDLRAAIGLDATATLGPYDASPPQLPDPVAPLAPPSPPAASDARWARVAMEVRLPGHSLAASARLRAAHPTVTAVPSLAAMWRASALRQAGGWLCAHVPSMAPTEVSVSTPGTAGAARDVACSAVPPLAADTSDEPTRSQYALVRAAAALSSCLPSES